jgi:hypothetical protein
MAINKVPKPHPLISLAVTGMNQPIPTLRLMDALHDQLRGHAESTDSLNKITFFLAALVVGTDTGTVVNRWTYDVHRSRHTVLKAPRHWALHIGKSFSGQKSRNLLAGQCHQRLPFLAQQGTLELQTLATTTTVPLTPQSV